MLKQGIFYFILSLVIILFAPYAKILLTYANLIYTLVNSAIEPLFGQGMIGDAFQDMCTLLLFPLVLAGLPALLYWVVKRKKMPYFIELTWLIWLIFAMSSYLTQ